MSSTMGSVVATPRVVVQRRVLWMLWSCACKKRKPFCGTRPHHYCASQSAVLRPSPPAARLSPLVEPISHAARRGGNALPPPPPRVGCGRRQHGTALAPARRRSMATILAERRLPKADPRRPPIAPGGQCSTARRPLVGVRTTTARYSLHTRPPPLNGNTIFGDAACLNNGRRPGGGCAPAQWSVSCCAIRSRERVRLPLRSGNAEQRPPLCAAAVRRRSHLVEPAPQHQPLPQ